MTIVEYKPEEILYDSPFSVAASIFYLTTLHLYHYSFDVFETQSYAQENVEKVSADQ